MGLLLVTHDVGVAAGSVGDVLVMRHGRAVEHGLVTAVPGAPGQAYTRELLAAVPRVEARRVPGDASGSGEVVLEAIGLRREFGLGKRAFAAVDDVSMTVRRGETLGIVGESGSGRATLGRCWSGCWSRRPVRCVTSYEGRVRPGVGPAVQMVFQGPADEVYDNPRDPYTRQLLASVPALDPDIAARRRAARRELAVV